MRRCVLACVCAGLVGGTASSSEASLLLGRSTSDEQIRVTAAGTAMVSWTEAGRRRHVIVRGSHLSYRGGLGGRSSASAQAPEVPFAVAQVALPDGTKFALQHVQRDGQFGKVGPPELRFSRWHGAATQLEHTGEWAYHGRMPRICGTATFHGTPFFGRRHTRAGRPLDAQGRNVYLDVFRARGWYRIMGVLTRPDGFALLIRTGAWRGSSYRATVPGPNVGSELAPDATATAAMPARSARHACPFGTGKYRHA